MTKYIVNLLNTNVWYTLFVACFFFGLFFILFVLLGAVGSHDDSEGSDHELTDTDMDGSIDGEVGHGEFEADHDFDTGIDSDLDHDFDIDHDLETGIDTDLDHDFDTDHDFDSGIDSDLNHDFDTDHDLSNSESTSETHVNVQHYELGVDNDSYQEESQYLLGNIAVFLLVWGQIGWLTIGNLDDLTLMFALLGGYGSSKAFAWFISNYAKTVINPIRHITRGDVGEVIYGVSPYKAGMVQVKRRDGVISTIIARGAYPHDIFDRGEKGYIWSKGRGIYTITKGLRRQPNLSSENKRKHKNKAF